MHETLTLHKCDGAEVRTSVEVVDDLSAEGDEEIATLDVAFLTVEEESGFAFCAGCDGEERRLDDSLREIKMFQIFDEEKVSVVQYFGGGKGTQVVKMQL